MSDFCRFLIDCDSTVKNTTNSAEVITYVVALPDSGR